MVIGGGQCNCVGGAGGVIVGGTRNIGGGYNINHTTIGGGTLNTASAQCSTVLGGNCNTASSASATVLGGNENIASGSFSLAGGYYNRSNSGFSIALGCGGCTSFPGQFAVGAENHISGLSFSAGIFQFSDLMAFNKALSTVETYFTTGQEVLLYPADNSSNLLKPSTNKVWHVTAKYSMYVGAKSGTVDGINVGDTLFGTTEFGYRNGTNGFITSSIRDNKVTNNEALNTGSFVFTYGASQEIVTKMIIPEFTGGGSLKVRGAVKFELVETLQG
jgi:hypothetical protein